MKNAPVVNGVRKITPSLVSTGRGQMHTLISKIFEKIKKPPTPNGIDGFIALSIKLLL